MEKIQIMVCYNNGKWMSDFITVDEYHTQKEAVDAYMKQYEQVWGSMEIVSKLLPSIINISVMGD